MSKAWYKHYPSDWRSDKLLRQVSREARSFWLDCIGLMHEEDTHRLEMAGRPTTIKELAKALGDNPRTAKKLMNELTEFGVCSVDCEGFTYSRRVLQDLKRAEKDVSNGRKGGNPALKTRENGDIGVNPEVKAQNQKPESEEESSSSARVRANDNFLDNILAAVGLKNGRIPTHWLPPGSMMHIQRWKSDLGLTESEILEAAKSSRSQHDDPPGGPKALDRVMKSLAATKSQDPLKPSGGRNDRNSADTAINRLADDLTAGNVRFETSSRDPFAS